MICLRNTLVPISCVWLTSELGKTLGWRSLAFGRLQLGDRIHLLILRHLQVPLQRRHRRPAPQVLNRLQPHPRLIEPGGPGAPVAVGAIPSQTQAVARLPQRQIARLPRNRLFSTPPRKQIAAAG